MARQWSGLFQRLLYESRAKAQEVQRIDILSEKFDDLKEAILSAITDDERRTIARGVVKFRRLNDFLRAVVRIIPNTAIRAFAEEKWTWRAVLELLEVNEVVLFPRDTWREGAFSGPRITGILVKHDDTCYAMYFPLDPADIEADIAEFQSLNKNSRVIILDALQDAGGSVSRQALVDTKKPAEQFVDELFSNSHGANTAKGLIASAIASK